MTSIPATLFKAKCLELMDQVSETGEGFMITKHGRPVARLLPLEVTTMTPQQIFGMGKEKGAVVADLLKPLDVKWSNDEDHFPSP
jgi:prevent-host-death family protein